MSSSQINVSEMEETIMNALENYKEEAEKAIGQTLPLVGRETVNELKNTSPKRTGAYARSWTYSMKESRGSRNKNKLIVHNKKYRLVHLLENGHAKRGGGRTKGDNDVKAIEHVKPAQVKAEKSAIERIKDKLERIKV